MYTKVVCCLCFCFTLIQNVQTQRINSWGSSQTNFKNSENSGFSSWNTNHANNIFSANQNSDFDRWNSKNSNDGSSVSGSGNSPSTWESNSFSTNNNNRRPNGGNGNKETWTSNSGNSNKRPKEDSSSLNFESSQNSNKKKNSANSEWNSNKFTSNESPKEQNDRKWESNSVSTANNRPNEEKLSSITNYPSSGTNWDTDSNDFLSSSGNDNNVYSNWESQNSRPSGVSNTQNSRPGSWGSNSVSNNNNNNRPAGSNGNSGLSQNSRPSDVSNTQNSRPGSWGSNTVSNANNKLKEDKSSSISNYPSSGTNWNTDSNNFVSSSENDKNVYSNWGSQNSRPSGVSNTQNSRPGSWGSNSVSNNNNNNRPAGSNGNSVSEDEENSVYSSFDSDNNNKKPNKNSGSGNWESNTQNNKKTEWSSGSNKKPNDKKSSTSNNSKPSGSGGWSSSSGSSNSRPVESEFSNFENEKPTKDADRPTDQQNDRKTSAPDTSILDELDKNDWYFGSEDNYPEPPFKTNLNIDVSALWNFDKNKKSNQNSDRNSNNNKRRRNRETGRLGMETRETVCECVNVNLCKEEDMIIIKEDAKNVGPLIEFRCKEYTDVCCRKPINLETVRESDIFGDEEEVDSLQCGQRRLKDSFYVPFEDGMALFGELPWIVRLRSFKNDVGCDGSLIHPRLALTAAHCVEGVNSGDLNITAGVWNSDNEPSQSRNVLDIIPHPDYNSKNPRNDIALLVLDESFQLTDNVNTICLPVTNDKWDLNGCFVADWRSNQINDRISEILGKGNVEFLPQYECQNILLVTEFWRKYILHDSFVCAVEKNGKSECLGEEGGALICPSEKSPDTYLQIGIVSKSLNCDDIGGPGIITNVLHFLDWINKNKFELGLYDDIDVRSL